ncbi:hypothetical protein NHX12_021345 [Muraenolepis orangiensis]|uniref:Uncharacterized protein n=1 Tax=Muraenolepis orangiensis TaxID=630683 RepID=A0A9Q0EQ93_9TELE|nr:hypothetical protein NHX12_021345 [Muraenolepis orangiensis]
MPDDPRLTALERTVRLDGIETPYSLPLGVPPLGGQHFFYHYVSRRYRKLLWIQQEAALPTKIMLTFQERVS